MDFPLRFSIPLEDIEAINVRIEAYRQAISFYESWKEVNGEWCYVEERILHLTNILCEYMIAASFAKEASRTQCGGSDLYEPIRKEFQAKYPNLIFPTKREFP